MKYRIILEADTLQELGMKILDTTGEVLRTKIWKQKEVEEKEETKVMKLDEPPEIPKSDNFQPHIRQKVPREEKKAAVPRGYVKDPGIKEAPPLGSEKKKGKIDKDLVKVLLDQGWTQSKIAKEMGVTQSAVYQIVKRYKLDEKDI